MLLLKQFPHFFHIRLSMLVEQLQPGAEGIESLLSRLCLGKTVLRTFAVAEMHPFAAATLRRKRIALGDAE